MTDELLKVYGQATLLARLEEVCVALERIQDAVTVCAEACDGGTAEVTAVARTLKYEAARPLGVQMSQLSSLLVQLRDQKP